MRGQPPRPATVRRRRRPLPAECHGSSVPRSGPTGGLSDPTHSAPERPGSSPQCDAPPHPHSANLRSIAESTGRARAMRRSSIWVMQIGAGAKDDAARPNPLLLCRSSLPAHAHRGEAESTIGLESERGAIMPRAPVARFALVHSLQLGLYNRLAQFKIVLLAAYHILESQSQAPAESGSRASCACHVFASGDRRDLFDRVSPTLYRPGASCCRSFFTTSAIPINHRDADGHALGGPLNAMK